jgi:hypothetical protein
MKRTFIVLSLATISVGIWLLVRTNPLAAVCSSLASPLAGTGVSANCETVLAKFFIGYALIVSGVVTMMLSLLSMVRHQRRRGDYRRDLQPLVPRPIYNANESERKAA